MVQHSYVLLSTDEPNLHTQDTRAPTLEMSFCDSILARRKLLMVFTAVLTVLIIIISVSVNLNNDSTNPVTTNVPDSEGEFESSSHENIEDRKFGVVGKSGTLLGVYENAAVSSDGVPCATIAKDFLKKGASAADATVAGMFCVGVVNSQSMGLGGGFFLTYYKKSERAVYTLDARETAPIKAHETMFSGNSSLSRRGPLSIAVPGELRGLHSFYVRYGGVFKWEELIEPTIKLCEDGFRVNWHMGRALKIMSKDFENEPTMSPFLNPETGKFYKTGDILKRPVLAQTLRAIQNNPDDLYSGESAGKLLEDLKKIGSIITKDDLDAYKPVWRTPISVPLSQNLTLHSFPPPGSGVLLAAIARILDKKGIDKNKVRAYQNMVEAFKYVYARRHQMGDGDFVDMSQLIEELKSERYAYLVASQLNSTHTSNNASYYQADFNKDLLPPNDHGTAHFSLVAPNGDAVSVTSTVNLYFGAGLLSPQTGIVLNDEMDDFSAPNITNYFGIPPSKANYIVPHKRPLSSMSPTIIVNETTGDIRLVLGAAGGTKIPTGIFNVMYHNLWGGKNIKEAVDARRLHHQVYPMTLMYEEGFDKDIVSEMEGFGHTSKQFSVGGSVVCAIERRGEVLYANADFRKSGQVDGS